MHPRDNRIALEACVDRTLYKLNARNIKIGIWSSEDQCFFGIREKFGKRFLDTENHWDAKDFASASPLEVIDYLPLSIDLSYGQGVESELFYWLDEQEKKLHNV